VKEDNGFSGCDRKDAPDPKQEQPRESVAGLECSSPPGIDFSSFVIFLATSAQMNLGSIPHPETGETTVDTFAAKQMTDILSILKDKTKGNLTEEESSLLD